MTSEVLSESTETSVRLSGPEATGLQALGRRLASTKAWWGDTDEESTSERSVIRVRPDTGDGWRLRVNDAVGAIAAGSAQFIVEPKVPNAHFLYLLEQAGYVPRLDPQRIALAADRTLWDLIAAWFTDAAELVLRRDLIRDYRSEVDELAVLRGRAQPIPTVRNILKGRVRIRCEFDEYDADNPLNRVLLAAAQKVAASPQLNIKLRSRARRVALRLDGVSALRLGDLRATTDRRTAYYDDALTLGRSVLDGGGRGLRTGDQAAWTFLIRTPELVEEGIRRVLADRLGGNWQVSKRALQLADSSRTLNPDLVFNDGAAVGDVKYKLYGPDWPSADLYQSVAFATGFRAPHAIVISFSTSGDQLPALQVGDVRVHNAVWNASPMLTPEEAAEGLVDDVRNWLADSIG